MFRRDHRRRQHHHFSDPFFSTEFDHPRRMSIRDLSDLEFHEMITVHRVAIMTTYTVEQPDEEQPDASYGGVRYREPKSKLSSSTSTSSSGRSKQRHAGTGSSSGPPGRRKFSIEIEGEEEVDSFSASKETSPHIIDLDSDDAAVKRKKRVSGPTPVIDLDPEESSEDEDTRRYESDADDFMEEDNDE